MEERKEGIFFTVDETLYLQYGQEIDEMLSISLDPDITLQMYEQYVQIRGIVMLKGEYRKYKNQQDAPFTEQKNIVYMEKVLEKSTNEARFSHRFPLDISIPNERVENMNDIEITIDAFDYDLPDVRTLNIEASLHIHGVKDKEAGNEQPEYAEEEVEPVNTKDHQDSESTEGVKEVENNTEPAPMESEEVDEGAAKAEIVQHEETKHEEGQKVHEAQETSETIFEADHSFAEEDTTVTEDSKEEVESVHVFDTQEQISADPETSTNDIDIQLSESETVEEAEEAFQDVQFLTDLFGGEEEEMKTTIKLYIIQEEDTLESIAKKYDIPPLELMKNNRLTGEDIEVGQLIQIPLYH